MLHIEELREALKMGLPMYWNDPQPIEGNDYTITYVEDVSDTELTNQDWVHTPILIQYGGGSEVQVMLYEIYLKEN